MRVTRHIVTSLLCDHVSAFLRARVYGDAGRRSYAGCYFLAQRHLNASVLKGGLNAWHAPGARNV
jgi:hypothetical protein